MTTVTAMADALDKIRARTGTPITDASADRLTYATFPTELKTAMKTAARDWRWERGDWLFHTQCCQAAMLKGVDPDELADRYTHPHPMCLKYRETT